MKPLLLLIDDNEDIVEYLAGELSPDYDVLKAFNGQEALEIMKDESVQLVISDVMMPGIDGFELCKIIKTDLTYSHIPILLLTAKNTLEAKIEGLENGADAYIEKPFSPAHLKAQVSSLLANRFKVKEYFAHSPLVHIKSIAYTKADETFLENLNEAINRNIDNSELDVEHLVKLLHMSRPTLYRKIKAISNLTPNDFINITRLKKSAVLLVEGNYKIADIARTVGFSSQTTFGKSFIKQFGITPTEYASSKRTNEKR
ncbi:MAG: signal transduction histidine kinase [Segetibacter sp.]|nr:signal transduction histidine kinase [Segetibacter sp.]